MVEGPAISLAYRKLGEVPDELCLIKGVKEVDLTASRLSVIPEGAFPPSLQVLTITGNDIARLPGDLHRLSNLQQLHAGTNRLTGIGKLLRCPKLLHVGLSFNQIQKLEVEEKAAARSPLYSLDLSHNDISDVEELIEGLVKLPALRCLAVQGNPLCLVPGYTARILSALPDLTHFDHKKADEASEPPLPSRRPTPPPEEPPPAKGKAPSKPSTPEPVEEEPMEEGYVYFKVSVSDVVAIPPPKPEPEEPEEEVEEADAKDAAAKDGKDAKGKDAPKGKAAPAAAPPPGEEEEEPLPPTVYHVEWSLTSDCAGKTVPVEMKEEEEEEAAAAPPAKGGKGAPPPEAEDSPEGFSQGEAHTKIPLGTAPRDLLRDGIEFRLVKSEWVKPEPPPPPEPAAEGEEGGEGAGAGEKDGAGGEADKDEKAAEGEGEPEEPPPPPPPVEVVTVVGQAKVHLMSFVQGEKVEAETTIELIPPPKLMDERGIYLTLQDECHVQPPTGSAKVVFQLHVPLPPPPPPEEEPAEGEAAEEKA